MNSAEPKAMIHRLFVESLAAELAAITAAAQSTIATATDKEHQARSKYETFSLESSYLARGQAKRVDELSEALERLKVLPLQPLDASTPIKLGALVRLVDADGVGRSLLLVPAGGGAEITVGGESIVLVTPSSPLGKAVLGRRVGELVELRMGDSLTPFTIDTVT